MKKHGILAIILSFIMALCSFASCAKESASFYELNFMSFNIKIPGGTGVQTWGSRKDAVMNFVNNSGADVIGLQEVSSTPYSDFRVNLASHYEMRYFQEHENLAIIYNKTVFKFVSQERYWLSETPDTRSYGWGETVRRMVAIVILEHIETGENIRVINTHGPLNDTANVNAFELIAERSLSGDSDMLTFMTGDFNATPNKLGYVPIAEKLQDCRVVAAESPNRDKNTFNNWGANTTAILDYCFVSKSKRIEVLTYQVRDDKWGDGNYISDHFAVQATVKIRENKKSGQ